VRLPGPGLHIAHPSLRLDLCEALGVRPLSRCIGEALEAGVALAPATAPPAAAAFGPAASAALKAPALAAALADVVLSQQAGGRPGADGAAASAAAAAASAAAAGGAGGGKPGGDGGPVVRAAVRPAPSAAGLAAAILRTLSGLEVVVAAEVPVVLSLGGVAFCRHSPLWFVDAPRRRLVLGVPDLTGSGVQVALVASLARAVCRVLETQLDSGGAGGG
jgi:hypothetical protein